MQMTKTEICHRVSTTERSFRDLKIDFNLTAFRLCIAIFDTNLYRRMLSPWYFHCIEDTSILPISIACTSDLVLWTQKLLGTGVSDLNNKNRVLRVVHMAGWKTSNGGKNNNLELSMANSFIVTALASIAPRHDGDVVCGRSMEMPQRSDSSCNRNGLSLNSPPTVSFTNRCHDGRSLASDSNRSLVWKQMASYAAKVTCWAVVWLFNPKITLEGERKS